MYKKYIVFGAEQAIFSDYKSVKGDKSVSLYSRVVVFLLPAIIFWITVLYLIKFAILAFVFSILGWIFFISSKSQVTFRQSLKTAMFTATPMVIIELALWPIKVMYVIPALIYLIYFVIGLIMVSERRYKHKGHHSGD